MLDPERFNFETPNVIDPGEMPPSRPSRQAASNDSYAKDLNKDKNDNAGTWDTTRNEQHSYHPNASDLHERNSRHYKPQLSQGIKLSDYRIDDYKDDYDGDFIVPVPPVQDRDDNEDDNDHDNNAEYGRSSQLPSSEQARLFAAAMLTESDRRRQDNTNNFGETVTLFRATSSKTQRERQRLCRHMMIWLGLLVLAAGFILAVIMLALQSSSNRNAKEMSSRMAATVDLLSVNGVTDEAELTTPGTPQNRAAFWIANEDRLQLDIPADITATLTQTETQNPVYPFVQRYALAVFYYSTRGEAWTNSLQFVSDQHECSWFQTMPDAGGEIYAVGVTCDHKLRVRNLLIRKCTWRFGYQYEYGYGYYMLYVAVSFIHTLFVGSCVSLTPPPPSSQLPTIVRAPFRMKFVTCSFWTF
jgi:hypothetical protein